MNTMNDKFNEIKRLELILSHAKTLELAIIDLVDIIAKELEALKAVVSSEIDDIAESDRRPE